MARDWKDLFIVDGTGASEPGAQLEPEARGDEPRAGRLRRLRESLRRTRQALSTEIQATLFEETQSEATWERLEEALIYADVGAATTAKVVEELEREAADGSISGGEALTARLTEQLAEIARTGDDRIDLRAKPTVILVAGVNGTGKTTTAGKLAFHIKELGHSVVLGAADTFRAAGVEQLEQWAQRAGVSFVKGPPDADPGSVAYDAIATARRDGADVVIIDTAGRLHTQEDLMAELAKVSRVIAKQIPDAPHETLLTVDATTGQNGLRQASLFSAAIGVDGLVLTKLDGTAKGGIVLAIAHELGIPVKLIGVGEQLEDLRPFDPTEFARALVGRE
jgi:fused signal recognition particle receptor